MPCYLTQKLMVDLTKVDAKFVTEALRGMESVGIAVDGDYAVVHLRNGESVVYKDGKLNITARSQERTKEIENEVKRGISKAVLSAASTKFRWTMNPVKGKTNEYEIEKRGF